MNKVKTYSRKTSNYLNKILIPENFEQVCRLCLSDDIVAYSIFETDASDNTQDNIAQKIKFCTNIQIDKNEGLPSNICHACNSQLDQNYSFKKKCEVNDKKLREHLRLLKEAEEQIELTYVHRKGRRKNQTASKKSPIKSKRGRRRKVTRRSAMRRTTRSHAKEVDITEERLIKQKTVEEKLNEIVEKFSNATKSPSSRTKNKNYVEKMETCPETANGVDQCGSQQNSCSENKVDNVSVATESEPEIQCQDTASSQACLEKDSSVSETNAVEKESLVEMKEVILEPVVDDKTIKINEVHDETETMDITQETIDPKIVTAVMSSEVQESCVPFNTSENSETKEDTSALGSIADNIDKNQDNNVLSQREAVFLKPVPATPVSNIRQEILKSWEDIVPEPSNEKVVIEDNEVFEINLEENGIFTNHKLVKTQDKVEIVEIGKGGSQNNVESYIVDEQGNVVSVNSSARFKCRLCPKVFRSKDFLARHMKNHLNQTPRKTFLLTPDIVCQYCNKVFATVPLLKFHQTIRHSFQKVICLECKKSYDPAAHHKCSEMRKPTSHCNYNLCMMSYPDRYLLNQHIASVHLRK